MRYRFIQAEKAHYPLTLLCRCLQVTRSGFYAWHHHQPSPREKANEELIQRMKQIHQNSRYTYGSPRMRAELRAQGRSVGKHRVARLMKQAGLCALRKEKKRRTTDSRHGLPIAPHLLHRQFTVERKNLVWVTDTTYLWTQEGFVYLAAIVDLYSRSVVGWATSRNHNRDLVLSALQQALRKRVPQAGLLHHSDQGCQYASVDYQQRLRAHGIVCSMSRKGDCYDNAVAESFFATLKKELIHRTTWTSARQIQNALFEYIEVFYNRKRRHSFLDYLSPWEYEQKHAEARSLTSA